MGVVNTELARVFDSLTYLDLAILVATTDKPTALPIAHVRVVKKSCMHLQSACARRCLCSIELLFRANCKVKRLGVQFTCTIFVEYMYLKFTYS